jgi:predicted O-methyltransferase YrrM
LTPKTCELLFIDGDHSVAGCLKDIWNYAPRVQSGGALVIHDHIREGDVAEAIKKSEDILSGFMATEVYTKDGIWIGFKI